MCVKALLSHVGYSQKRKTTLPRCTAKHGNFASLFTRRDWLWALLILLVLMLWDMTGLDMHLAHWFGTEYGFAMRDNWFLVRVMHEGGRALGWLLVLVLAVCVSWPVGVLRQLDMPARVQLVASALFALLVVSLFKAKSTSSCPWDMQEFGGLARYASHWAWGVADGGGGRCFPAGHASAGFAFLGGALALRPFAPVVARRWLWGALLTGLALGWGQQLRGAHFMSHTLWTGAVCWVVACCCDVVTRYVRLRKSQKRVLNALDT